MHSQYTSDVNGPDRPPIQPSDLEWLHKHVRPAVELHQGAPSPGGEVSIPVPPLKEGGGDRGLSLNKQSLQPISKPYKEPSRVRLPKGVPYSLITLRNFDTGDTMVFSTHQMRLHRLQKRVKAWAEAMKHLLAEGKGQYVLKMLTLTYRDVHGWEANHVRDFMLTVKREMGESLLSYAWVGEVQKRGAPHYHVMLLVKRGTWVPKPDKARWWKHGSTNVLQAKTPFYLLKYCGKEHQKAYQQQGLPKGARMFGCPQKLGAAAASPDAAFDFRLSAIPNWLAQKIQPIRVGYGLTVTWKRAEGGGWWLRWYEDGELQEKRVYSPWLFEGIERIEPYETVELEHRE